VPGGLGPDRVGDGILPVGEPGDGLGQRQRGALGVGEVGRVFRACKAVMASGRIMTGLAALLLIVMTDGGEGM